MEGISILVVSRHDKDRENILNALSLRQDFIITGVEKDEVGAIIKAERLKPKVLIIDLQPSGMDELEITSVIHRKTPSTSIILISENFKNTNEAFINGIRGFLLKEADAEEIVISVLAASRGSGYISAPYIKRSSFSAPSAELPDLSLALSPVERGIVTHLAKGLSDDEIAEQLNYSIGTIRNILVSIKRKTKLKNRVQIVIYSLVCGLIKLELKDIFNADKKSSMHK